MNKNYKRNIVFPGMVQSLLFYFTISVGLSLFPLLTKAAHPESSPVKGERPPIDILSVPNEALETGIIRIKFNRSQESFLDQSTPFFGQGGIIQFGIPAIDQLNIQFGVTAVQKSFYSALQNEKFTERHRQWGFHLWYDLVIPQGVDVRTMVMTYRAFDEIEFSEPVYKKQLIGANENNISSQVIPSGGTTLNYTPVDPRFNEQWHYHNTGQQAGSVDADIDLPEAWDIIKGNSNVIVAIIDEGIQHTHPDLAANMWPGIGYNFITNSPVIVPGNHGTHVAGTVAANTNNNTGVSGIAGGDGSGNGVRLMSCQVFNGSNSGGFHTAMIWAADNGATISQNSWGYTTAGYYEQAVLDAIDYFTVNGGGTTLNGGITFFSAGNYNNSGSYYPAYYSETIAVSATNNKDKKSNYSNYGSWIDISAPGGETNSVSARGVLSTTTSGNYGFLQGTSMACPHVSGVAALIVSLLPGILTPAELRDILLSTTDNIEALNPGYQGLLGSGRLNAYQALLLAQQYIIPTAAFSVSSTLECTGSSIVFTDQTLATVTSWIWNFPGGNPSSFTGQIPPPVQYNSPGFYEVSLTVSDGITTDTETKSALVEIRGVITDFSANTNSIIGGGTVTFTDLTDCGPDSWEWSFPGGTPSTYSGQTPPPIVYSLSGDYDVTLTTSKGGATDTKTAPAFIHVTPPPLNMFTGSITTCDGLFYDSGGPSGNYQNNQNQILTINPASSGAAIQLNFSSFFLQNNFDVLYIYNGTSTSDPLIGAYTGQSGPVTITSSHYTGALTLEFQSDCCGTNPGWAATISCSYATPVANFSASNLTPSVAEVITFQDISSNVPTGWNWSISPGTYNFLNGTDQSYRTPQVQFLAAGSYTIELTASNNTGTNTITKTDYISVSPSESCIPAYSSGSGAGDFISLVQLDSINHSSGAAPAPYYTNNSNLSANLLKGSPYTIKLAAGTISQDNNISAWIDYNQDNLFDPTEKLGNVTLMATPAMDSITFFVPQSALNGITKMRVRSARGINNIDPCSMYSFGETEDYRVNISPVVYCEPNFESGTLYGDYISLVQLQEINNATGPAPYPYYTYYNADTAILAKGGEYSLTLSAGTYSEENNMITWIDYDFDGVFEENEKLGFLSLPAMPETGVISFTVPETAYAGTTRMRVMDVTYNYEFGPCESVFVGEAEDYPVNITSSGKSLQLTVFLEGLYDSGGVMRQASDGTSPQFGPSVADQVTIELHNETNYSVIEHSFLNVDLSTSGQLNLQIPGTLTGAYYVTIRHRNSIETTTAVPVSFAGIATNYSFDNPSKAFGNNLVLKADGNYAIYSGDISQDGIVDGSDMAAVDNASTIVLTGYVAEDTNGDGLVDGSDMALIDNNATMAITAILP